MSDTKKRFLPFIKLALALASKVITRFPVSFERAIHLRETGETIPPGG